MEDIPSVSICSGHSYAVGVYISSTVLHYMTVVTTIPLGEPNFFNRCNEDKNLCSALHLMFRVLVLGTFASNKNRLYFLLWYQKSYVVYVTHCLITYPHVSAQLKTSTSAVLVCVKPSISLWRLCSRNFRGWFLCTGV